MGITTGRYHTQIKKYLFSACLWLWVPQSVCGGQRAGCGSHFSPATAWDLGSGLDHWSLWQVLHLPSHFAGPPPAVFKCGFSGWSAGLHAGMASLTAPSPQPKTFLFVSPLLRLSLSSKFKVVRGRLRTPETQAGCTGRR